eukprot:19226-Heterococcus_DN1.PRE.5
MTIAVDACCRTRSLALTDMASWAGAHDSDCQDHGLDSDSEGSTSATSGRQMQWASSTALNNCHSAASFELTQLSADERSLKRKAERTQRQRAKKEQRVDAEYKEQLSADICLLPWVQAAATPSSTTSDPQAAAVAGTPDGELVPVQQQQGTAAMWELVLMHVAAQYLPNEVRGVTAVAQDIARTACVCRDTRVAAAAGWRTLATRCPALPALQGTSRSWQTIVNYPLHIRADELKAAARGLKLVLKGTKAVLAQRLLKALGLTGPTAVPVAILAAAKTERSSKAYAWLGYEQYALYTAVRKLANMSDATAAAAMKAVNNTVLFRKALLDGGYNSKHELNAALAKAQAAKKGSASATASAATALTVVTGISIGGLN